jgi:hypothetical protein
LFRAARGPVYQVLQNAGTDVRLGADGFQITSVIGTGAGPLFGCDVIANATVDPQAGIATDPQFAFPPERVFKSPIILDATIPCFGSRLNGGRGGVCIGPDCDSDCRCVSGACVAFTIDEGVPITESTDGVPSASLVTSIPPLPEGSFCSNLAGKETYAFGGSGPTTSTRQCQPAPPDGFVLRSTPSTFSGGAAGTTIIFAYDTPLASLFAAGSAGFEIDEDGNNVICPNRPGALHVGRSQSNPVEAPEIRYTANGGVSFDFDNDNTIDKTVSTCVPSALLQCR